MRYVIAIPHCGSGKGRRLIELRDGELLSKRYHDETGFEGPCDFHEVELGKLLNPDGTPVRLLETK